MADIKDHASGHGGSGDKRYFHDEGDGTWAKRIATALRGWDTGSLVWQRVRARVLTNSTSLDVSVVDGSGNQVTSFGGSGGTSATDDSAFTPATGTGTPIMGFADETAPDSVDEGDVGVVRMTLPRALHVNLRDAAGAEVAVGGGTQYTEDAAAAANPVGTALNLIRNDTLEGLTTADGDNVAARGTDKGELYVKHVDAIPVTDNAGSLTVDGSVSLSAAVPAGTNNIGDVDVLTMPDVTAVGKAADGAAVAGNPVLVAGQDGTNAQSLKTDANGELQIDVLSIAAGDNNIGNVDVVTMPTTTVTATDLDIRNLDVAQDDVRVGGMAASDAAVADNPIAVGGRASTAIPTAVSADGDAVFSWLNRSGANVVTQAPHVGLNSDPFNLLHETAQYTTTQTGTALVTPTAGKKLVVTKVQIQVGGTTAGTFQLWFGGSADTTYTRGTDRAIFDGEFAPSATLKPGVVMDGPWIAGAADDILRVTDSAAINPITVTVWYYEI